MFEERRRILNMLAEGKISAEDAERLLDAIDAKAGSAEEKTECCDKENPRYLRILVNPKSGSARHDRVDVRIPIFLIKAGARLTSIMPDQAREKIRSKFREKGLAFDIDSLDARSIDSFIEALAEASIDVDDEDEHVRIFCC
jgi:hypothetical protein